MEIIRDDEDADVEYGTVLEFEVDELVVRSSMELEEREDCLRDKLETSNVEKGEHEL